ncbi:MAG: hypothetical protein WCF85_02125 [Rhodospirillaceae bacterium]
MDTNELAATLAKLVGLIETERAENMKFRQEARAKFAVLEAGQAGLEAGQAEIRTELKVISARLDEQRQTINAMIPTRLAAVPGHEERRAS